MITLTQSDRQQESSAHQTMGECNSDVKQPKFTVRVPEILAKDFLKELSGKARLYRVCLKIRSLEIIAEELFSEVKIEIDSDCEIPSAIYFVFCVNGDGTPRRMADLRLEWYEQTDEILGDDCEFIRLKIAPISSEL